MNYPNNPYMPQSYLRYGQNPYQQQMPVQQPVMPQQPQGYSPASMPVSSKEEALAQPADFVVFAPELPPDPEPEQSPAGDYVSKGEFRKAIEKMYAEIEKLKGVTFHETESE